MLRRAASSAALGAELLATPSPSLRRSGSSDGGVSLPKPPETGNEIVDNDTMESHKQLELMVAGLLENRQHIMPLVLQYQKRIRADEEAADDMAKGGELSEKAFKSLASMDEEWLLDWLCKTSENKITAAQLVKAKKVDPESVYQMACFALQFPMLMKMPDVIRVKDIAFRAFNSRADEAGKRLTDFCKDGATKSLANGQINWANGCYKLRKQGNKFTSVIHMSGGSVDISSEMFTTDYKLDNNLNDWEGQLKKGRFPGVRLHLFFDAGMGPYKTKQVTNKNKQWDKDCEAIAQKWQEERAKLTKGNAVSEDAKASLKQLNDEKQAAGLKRAREVSKGVMAARKDARKVDLTNFT